MINVLNETERYKLQEFWEKVLDLFIARESLLKRIVKSSWFC